MRSEHQVLIDLFKEELDLKEEIINKISKEKESLIEKNERLEMTLKIPRKHMEFMRDNGKLEEFVDAKLLGKDAEAKWILLNGAERNIDHIMDQQA